MEGCSYNQKPEQSLASPADAVECAHATQEKVLESLVTHLTETYRWFQLLPGPDDGLVGEETQTIMTIGLREYHNVWAMAAVLAREASSCKKCSSRKAPKAPVEGSINDQVVENDGNLDTSEDDDNDESKQTLAAFNLIYILSLIRG